MREKGMKQDENSTFFAITCRTNVVVLRGVHGARAPDGLFANGRIW